LDEAPDYLRVAIILLSQTGGRTYSEGFSLRWSQVDFDYKVIRLDNTVKTTGSTEPIPLSQYACDVLQAWKLKSSPVGEYVFPESGKPRQAHFNGQNGLASNAQTSWRDSISDLQLASRLLYSAQRSGSGRGRATRHAPYKPRNKTSLPVGNGRAGKASSGENQQAAVRKAGTVTFP
jgi:integrase